MPGDGLVPDRHMRATVFVDGGHRLILRWRPYLNARPLRPPPPQEDAELLSNVQRIEVAFWQPDGGWVPVWRAAYLPVLIRVRLRFPAGDARHWPDIVAAPGLDRS
jgi:general secretion pathway protein J